jgi:amino acid transporter
MSSPIQGSLAKDRLGVPSVVFFVMSAAAPLTVVAGVVTTGYATTQIKGIPFGFITIAVLLAFFSVGYVSMSRYITNAGAFYTYVTHGLGRPLGVGTAWMALLSYNALQIGLYGIIGDAAAPLLKRWAHVEPKWWVIALATWLIVAILGVLRVDVNGKILALLLCAEIVLVLIYDVADLAKPAAGKITFDTLLPGNLFGSGIGAAGAVLVLTFLGFTGFESAVVFSEESKNPRRTIALATYLAVGIIGGTYALSSWAMSVATGPDQIIAASQQNGPGTIFGLAADRLAPTFVDIGSVLFATSVLAAAISFHNTVARYTFALGRERVFPGFLSATGRRSGAPTAGSIVQSLVGLAVIVLYAAFGLNPVVQLMFWVGTGGGFGILLLLALTSVAVVVFFIRTPNQENVWRRLIAPALSAIALSVVVYWAVDGFNNLLTLPDFSPMPSNHPLHWIIPALFPAVALLGIVWALILKATKPDVYAAIGLGANSVTGLTSQSRVVAPTPHVAAHAAATVGAGQDVHR